MVLDPDQVIPHIQWFRREVTYAGNHTLHILDSSQAVGTKVMYSALVMLSRLANYGRSDEVPKTNPSL